MRYNPFGYQGVPNQRKFRAAATGRPLQWARSDRPAALAAYLNIAFRSMLTPAGWGVLEPARRAALLDLIGQPAPDPHDQGKVWAFNLGCGKDVGKPVLLCPFAITRIGVMANGVQPMKPRSTARPNRGW